MTKQLAGETACATSGRHLAVVGQAVGLPSRDRKEAFAFAAPTTLVTS